MNTVQKPDLSFTENPEWQEQRLLLWSPIEKDLKSDCRKKQIEDFKQYFLFGNVQGEMKESGKDHGSTALLYWYPLQSAEGWDYVLQYLCPKSHVFEYEFYRCIDGHSTAMPDIETQLRFFDYFHPVIYESVIKSRVPIGRQGENVEFMVDKDRVIKLILVQYLRFIERDEDRVGLHRFNYFKSLLNVFDNESNEKIQWLFERILKQIDSFKPKKEIKDDSKQLELLSKLKDYFAHENNNPVLAKIKNELE